MLDPFANHFPTEWAQMTKKGTVIPAVSNDSILTEFPIPPGGASLGKGLKRLSSTGWIYHISIAVRSFVSGLLHRKTSGPIPSHFPR